MDEKWLDSYDGQTTDELLALKEDYRLDSLVLAFEQALQRKAQKHALTREERYVLAIESLEREVNNGGYDQFFVNSRSQFLDVLEEALRAIGCPTTADITRSALEALGVLGPLTDAALEARLLPGSSLLRDSLIEHDQRYDSAGEALAVRLFEWIERNKESVRVGDV